MFQKELACENLHVRHAFYNIVQLTMVYIHLKLNSKFTGLANTDINL